MAKTNIEWAQYSLNCVTGCTRQSDGCTHCYALTMSSRCSAMGIDKYDGVTEKKDGILDWTGKIRTFVDVLNEPGKRKVPTRYFVNSMSDTFHKDVPFDFIDKIFQMCLNNPCHEFMILTKRPENILKYLASGKTRMELVAACKNVILMATVENQEVANHRIKNMLSIRLLISGLPIGLSCEPLLGPIDFEASVGDYHYYSPIKLFNWIICGGESGPKARPMHPEWVRNIELECLYHHVPFFFKQWGEWVPGEATGGEVEHFKNCYRLPDGEIASFVGHPKCYLWDEDKYTNYSNGDLVSFKVGKKKAGRILDGRTWDELPDLRRDR